MRNSVTFKLPKSVASAASWLDMLKKNQVVALFTSLVHVIIADSFKFNRIMSFDFYHPLYNWQPQTSETSKNPRMYKSSTIGPIEITREISHQRVVPFYSPQFDTSSVAMPCWSTELWVIECLKGRPWPDHFFDFPTYLNFFWDFGTKRWLIFFLFTSWNDQKRVK